LAVPKRRLSKARGRHRRAHWKLNLPGVVKCPQCNEDKLPHRVCPSCGFYKNKEVIKTK